MKRDLIKNPVFLLNGPPGAGKDTTAKVMSGPLQSFVYSHVEAVRQANFYAWGLNDSSYSMKWLQDNKNEKLAILNGMSWRETVIATLEAYHLAYGRDFWANITIRKIAELSNDMKDCAFFVTDMSNPEQVEAYEKAFPDRAIIVRIHRQGTDFGKLPGFEHAYGAGTGKDSRNWLFSDVLPFIEFTNDGNEHDLFCDFIRHIDKLVDVYAIMYPEAARSNIVDMRNDRHFNITQMLPIIPFAKPYQIYEVEQKHSKYPTVKRRLSDLENLPAKEQ